MKEDIFIIIQARTGSNRLPNKMLMHFYKQNSIPEIIIHNLKRRYSSDKIILATSDRNEDDSLEVIAFKNGIKCFRGDENDVLKRFIDCASLFQAKTIVRICADNPFLQVDYLKPIIENLLINNLDYCSYKWPDDTPVMLSHIGVFAEVMNVSFLEKISDLTDDPFYHEHVTNYLYSNKGLFNHDFLAVPYFLNPERNIRLTIDTIEDFNLLQELYVKLYRIDPDFNLEDLLRLIHSDPNIINEMVKQIEKNEK